MIAIAQVCVLDWKSKSRKASPQGKFYILETCLLKASKAIGNDKSSEVTSLALHKMLILCSGGLGVRIEKPDARAETIRDRLTKRFNISEN